MYTNRGNRKWRRTFFRYPVPCLYINSYALSPKRYPFPLILTDSDPSLPIAKCLPRPSHHPLWLTPSPSRLNSLNPSRLSPHLASPTPNSGLFFSIYLFFCVNFIILLKSLLIFISFVIVDSPQRKKQKKEKKKENFFLKKVLLEWIIFRATKRSFSLSCLNCYIWRIYLDLYMDLQLLRENPFIWQN